jgi:ribosomal protein S18 acetylase RimI-like enzyme
MVPSTRTPSPRPAGRSSPPAARTWACSAPTGRPGEIYLARTEFHPDCQGNGIGTRLTRALADEAAQNSQAPVLDMLTADRRAQSPYQRPGMRKAARHGEGTIKITMRPSPQRR